MLIRAFNDSFLESQVSSWDPLTFSILIHLASLLYRMQTDIPIDAFGYTTAVFAHKTSSFSPVLNPIEI